MPVARGIEAELQRSREHLHRVTPQQAWEMQANGVPLIDTRTEAQQQRDGTIPGSVSIDRTVMEWRLDPTSPTKADVLRGYADPVVVFCAQGYSSSLAARSLQRIGLTHATDMIGGFQAWVAAGLPVIPGIALDP